MLDNLFDMYWNKKDCYAINEKKLRVHEYVRYMLDRTQQIFKWEGLPKTIPSFNLENLLQTCGNVCITEVESVPDNRGDIGLYAFFGGLGGLPNAYYEPTIYTVANPYLEFNKELLIGVDCIRGRNDQQGVGLLPLIIKYCAMLNENEISLNMLAINYRIDNLISADNDRAFESAKNFLDGIIKGQYGAISSDEFFDGIRNDKVPSGTNRITDLIEYEQYLKASMYNEIGLNSNYNMKRERITSSEVQLNDDALMPLIDNMLEWRLKLCDDVKNMYGDKYDLDGLTVKLSNLWDLDRIYVDAMPEACEPEGEEPDEETPDEETPDEENPDEENSDEENPDEENPDEEEPEEEEPEEEEPEEEGDNE